MEYLLIPIVGAIIGYITNWVAVKMLFHPRKEIYLGSWKLPFTPGVIPKGQKRLARAVGRMVQDKLLTRDMIYDRLLSSQAEDQIKDSCRQWLAGCQESSLTWREMALCYIPEGNYENAVEEAKEKAAALIYQKAVEMQPGHLIAENVIESVRDKLSDSFLGMMVPDSLLASVAEYIEERINAYIEENGREYIDQSISEYAKKLQDKPVGESLHTLTDLQIPLEDILFRIYKEVIDRKLDQFLMQLGVSDMVEKKINDMEVEEVENLVLIMMKNELGAIVNLGAVIGFILGLLNLVILKI